MKNEIDILIEKYHKFIADKTAIKQKKQDVFEILTPFLDRHNDYISLYLKKESENVFLISDDGETVSDLESSGMFFTEKRLKLLETVLNGFGVSFNKETKAIETKAGFENFAVKKHNLIQAVCSSSDMFFLSNPVSNNFFVDDVKNFFEKNNFAYVSDISVTGKTGFARRFSFVIPKTKELPERLIKPINNLNHTTVDSAIMDYLDIAEVRENSKVVVIANDIEKPVPENTVHALKSYGIGLVPWSQKETFRIL